MYGKKVRTATTRFVRVTLGVILPVLLLLLIAGSAIAAPIVFVDDAGADDEPGQKDLNSLSVDYAPAVGDLFVSWGWDNTDWSGNNTGDACTLFDTDSDGFANYSICVTVAGSPAAYTSTVLYSCGDTSSDRCTNPIVKISPFTSNGNASVVAGSDPFGDPASDYYTPTHITGGTCAGTPGCYTADTIGNLTIDLNDFGGSSAKLINVCSYPSGEPNSDPSDCVITPNNGFLTIVKVADPDADTPFVFTAGTPSQTGDSTWTINGSGSVQLISYHPGTGYDLSEVVPTAWMLDSASCFIQTNPPALTGALSGSTVTGFEIRSGLETICTFNDTLKPGTLTLNKTVINDNGGDAVTTDFQASINDVPVAWGVPYAYDAGTKITASEATVTGYTPSVWGGDCDADGAVTIEAGVDKTCTITNDDIAPKLTLVKDVVNDDGGDALSGDFNLTIGGTAAISGTAYTLQSNTPYAIQETQLTGYAFVSITGDPKCPAVLGGTVTLDEGDDITCTIKNDDVAPKLTLVKNVVNDDGGSAEPNDFNLTIGGDPATSGTAYALKANMPYAIDETQLSGYTFLSISGDPKCPAALGGSVTLDEGDDITCTITNDDQQAYITVVKVVNNDHGGTAVPDDFNLTLDGNAVDNGVPVPVDPGTYTAGETLLPGYIFDGFSGACNSSGEITVALGESKTCTLTNSDQQAYITVVKVVNNDHGGTAAPNDFNLTLDGNAVDNGVPVPVDPGTYTAGETLLPGYIFDGFSDDCDTNGHVTVALGESKTCTLTNSDQQAYITVVKMVNNDHGGTAAPNDFSLTLDGNAVDNGVPVPVDPGTYTAGETLLPGYIFDGFSDDCNSSGEITVALGESKTCTLTNSDQQAYITLIKKVITDNGGTAKPDDFHLRLEDVSVLSGVQKAVDPGTYKATEDLVPGYEFLGYSGDCDTNGSITVALGESKTCTLTNDDMAPTLTVIKHVINDNGGMAVASDFIMTVHDTNVQPSASFAGSEDGVIVTLYAGTYNVTEDGPSGYAASFDGCTGTIALGESKTCTITNDDVQPKLIVIKHVVNYLVGDKLASDFIMLVSGNNPSLTEFPGDEQGTEVMLDAGEYNVDEIQLDKYTATFSDDCSGSITIGETKTCTVTNTRELIHPGTIGFWKNWSNHYTEAQIQMLIDYLKENNPNVYYKNDKNPLTVQVLDAILNLGKKTPRAQMILAQLTATKLNLAVTQLDGTGGIVQKNDDICLAGTVYVSGIKGAANFFGSSTPTIGDIVAKVEGKWTGKLTTNRSDWKFNLTTTKQTMVIKVLTGINEGTLVIDGGCQ